MPSSERELVEIREDGREVYAYPDGTKRYASGAYASAPPWKAPNFDENSANKRWEMVREAAAEGIMTATETVTERDSVRAVAERATKTFLEEKSGIAGIQSMKFGAQLAGWLPDRSNGGQAVVQAIQVNISSDLVRHYVPADAEAGTVRDDSDGGGE